jgi:hypothetical protein
MNGLGWLLVRLFALDLDPRELRVARDDLGAFLVFLAVIGLCFVFVAGQP